MDAWMESLLIKMGTEDLVLGKDDEFSIYYIEFQVSLGMVRSSYGLDSRGVSSNWEI